MVAYTVKPGALYPALFSNNKPITPHTMYHLFQHKSGKLKNKYDFAFVSKGRFISGSNQGYENKTALLKIIFNQATVNGSHHVHVQDETRVRPVVMYLVRNLPLKNIIISDSFKKPSKPYMPQK